MDILTILFGFAVGLITYGLGLIFHQREMKKVEDELEKQRYKNLHRDIDALRKHYMDVPLDKLLRDGEYIKDED